MKKDSYTNSFTSSKTSEEVFEALLNVGQWWSGFYEETIKGKSKQVNDEFIFKAGGGAHYSKQKLIELIPNKKIVWLVTDSKLNFLSNSSEWNDSRICFDISREKNNTTIKFTHDGLVPQIECYNECSAGWRKYLGKLKNELE